MSYFVRGGDGRVLSDVVHVKRQRFSSAVSKPTQLQMRKQLQLAVLVFAIATLCSAQQPDAIELVKTTIANAQRNFILSQNYTFQVSNDWTYYNQDGAATRHEIKKFDAVFVHGEWYWRLSERDGRPLSGKEAEEEQRKWEQEISGVRARLLPAQKQTSLFSFMLESRGRRRSHVTREPIPFEDLPRLFELKLLGIEQVNNHQAYLVMATPRPEIKPANQWEDVELHDKVKLWIDVAEQAPVRLHVDVLTDRGMVARDSSNDMEWEKVNGEVWLLTRNLLRLPKARAQCEDVFSNFRRFDVDVRVLNSATRSVVESSGQPKTATSTSGRLQAAANSSLNSDLRVTADRVAISSVVEKGFAAYQRGDLPALFSLFSETSPNLLMAKVDIQNNIAYFGKGDVKNLDVEAIETAGDTATARLSFEISGGEPGRSSGKKFYLFELVRESGAWRLWGGESEEAEFAGALLAADSEEERQRLLSEQAPLVTAELADQLVGQGNSLISIGDYVHAVASFQLANTVAEHLGAKEAIWKALYGLGHGSLVEGHKAQAEDYFGKSLALCAQIGNKSDLAFANSEIGKNYFDRGDYRKAMQYYKRSLRISTESGAKERLASTLEAIGDLFVQQGNDEQGLEQYRKSLKLFEELEASVDVQLRVPGSLSKIAGVLTRQGSYTQALEYYQKNLKILERLGARSGTAVTLQNIGDNYFFQARLPEALEYYGKSLDLFEEQEHKPEIARTLNRMASVYYALGEYERAISLCHRAADISRELDNPSDVAAIQTTLGRAYVAMGQYDQARQALAEAIANIETLRTHVAGTEQDQERFFEGRVNPYHAIVELLIQQQDFAEALKFAELAKGRALLDVLQNGKDDITKAMTPDEQRQEQSLNEVLIALNSQIENEQAQREPRRILLRNIETRLKKARLEYESFETRVYVEHPDLMHQRGESRPLSLEALATLITDGSTALLEYEVTEDRTYLFFLGKDEKSANGIFLNAYPIEVKSRDLARRAESFRQKLAAESLDFRNSARELYKLLLGPVQKELGDKKTVCLVPSGPLWELPFQALLSAQNRYVLEDHTIFYAPSFSVLREMRNRTEEAARERFRSNDPSTRRDLSSSQMLFAVGNPKLVSTDPDRVGMTARDAPYAPLPEQEQLVRRLGQIYGAQNSRILTGKAAQEEVVRTEAGKYKVLHFATHAILDNDDPMYSRLLLSRTREDENGILDARAIMRLELHADLAVLSGCETARGRVHEGEGMIGMSWAVFVAGTPTTIVSQWKIDSFSTAHMMMDFHRMLKSRMAQQRLSPISEALHHPALSNRQLRSGPPENELRLNKAEALRQAALDLMKNPAYRHPFYWAGFVVMGDGL